MKTERELLEKLTAMCEESLAPEMLEKWFEVKENLIKNRPDCRSEADNWDATCDGCGIGINNDEIAYTNRDGENYCNDCWLGIQGDPENLAGLKEKDA